MDKTEKQGFREYLQARYREKYPDVDFDDDDNICSKLVEELENFEKSEASYNENRSRLEALWNKDPRMGALLSNAMNGGDPVSFLIEHFGDEFKDALESDSGREKFSESYGKWLEKVAADKRADEEREQNFKKSAEELSAFQQEHNLTDEQALEVFQKLHNIIVDGLLGVYRAEDYLMAYKALNYDKDIEAAKEEGAIEGRNYKIEERLKRSKEKRGNPPSLPGGASMPAQEEQEEMGGAFGRVLRKYR